MPDLHPQLSGSDEQSAALTVPMNIRRPEVSARLQDIRGVLSRHRWLIIACAVVTTLAGMIGTWRQTPIYQASTTLRIDKQQSNLPALDVLNQIQGGEIETEIEVLKTRNLAAVVADTLGLRVHMLGPKGLAREQVFTRVSSFADAAKDSATYGMSSGGTAGRILGRGLRSVLGNMEGYRLERLAGGRYALELRKTGAVIDTVAVGEQMRLDGASFAFTPEAPQRDQYDFRILSVRDATNLVQNNLTISRPVELANIVRLTYESPDPYMARSVPDELAALYMAQRQSMASGENEGTVKFLKDQISKLSVSLAAQEDTLRRFRESQNLVSIQDQARGGVEQLEQLRAQRNQIDAERSALSALLTDVHASAAKKTSDDPSSYRYLMAFPALLKNGAAAGVLQSLNELETKRAELLTRRKPTDPDVLSITGQITQLENQLNGVASTYYKGLVDQVSALDATITRSSGELRTIPGREITLDRMERQPKVLESLYGMLQTRLKEAEIAAAATDPTVHIVDSATQPRVPVRPKPLVNVALALLAGLLVGIAAAFGREYADKNVHSRIDMLSATQLPVLGLIPRIPRGDGWAPFQAAVRHVLWLSPKANADKDDPATTNGSTAMARAGMEAGEVLEAFNRLAVNIAYSRPAETLHSLIITSAAPGDGKTTVALNLALTLAQRGRRILLIDADLRRGRIHAAIGAAREPGLSDLLHGEIPLSTMLHHVSIDTGVTIDVITSGRPLLNAAPVLADRQLSLLLDSVRSNYDLVIVDTPPLNVVSDAISLAASANGVILVARAGVTNSGALSFALEQLLHVKATIIGTVLNDVDFERDIGYDATYRYYRYDPKYYSQA